MTDRLTNDVAKYARMVAKRAVERRSEIDYTQTAARWSGIDQVRDYPKLPPHADCSSFTTWVFWTARRHIRGVSGVDVVNNLRWEAGYTGTQIQHGAQHRDNHPGLWKPGRTLVFYADAGTEPTHVALWVGDLIWNAKLGTLKSLRDQQIVVEKNGKKWILKNVVISHGQDAGPQIRAWSYRRVVSARAYAV
jgi:hypothetical protein